MDEKFKKDVIKYANSKSEDFEFKYKVATWIIRILFVLLIITLIY